MVTALSGVVTMAHRRAALLQSWIEFECLRSAGMCKVARIFIYWQDVACRWVIPELQVALAQLYKYHHQGGEWQSSLKAALEMIKHVKCTLSPLMLAVMSMCISFAAYLESLHKSTLLCKSKVTYWKILNKNVLKVFWKHFFFVFKSVDFTLKVMIYYSASNGPFVLLGSLY